jgi:nitroimidazol reductase NimA-like FMN-containing flavoprotein (pyridoxamine 5'-phosphate oxidase superfamily)
MKNITAEMRKKIKAAKNIWFASVRPDGRPHLTPVWFVYVEAKFYMSIDPKSIKSRNLAANPRVSLALEDGLHPVICEGTVKPIEAALATEALSAFLEKYEWDVTADEQYHYLLEVTPQKWLAW